MELVEFDSVVRVEVVDLLSLLLLNHYNYYNFITTKYIEMY